MDSMQYKLIEWMAAVLHEDNSKLAPVEPAEWRTLFQEIFKQGLSPICFPLVHTIPEENKPAPGILSFWKRQALYSATLQLHKTEELKGILDVFRDGRIPAIVFKGPAIARFYNYPEYRPMSDVDILVRDRDNTRAHREILSMGYALKAGGDDHPVHCEYQKEGSLCIELHRSLLHPGFWAGGRWMNGMGTYGSMPGQYALINWSLRLWPRRMN